jgi:cation:H+ antiporter
VLIDLAIIIISLFFLLEGSDFFVTQVARLAKLFKVSDFVIGLTVVAIGTSLPELSTSIAAALLGSTELILGNVVGSNLANIALVLGLTSIFAVVSINEEIYGREGVLLFLVTLLFFIMSFDRTISAIDGGFLILIFVLYIFYFIEYKTLRKMHGKGLVYRSFYFGKLLKDRAIFQMKQVFSYRTYLDVLHRENHVKMKDLVKFGTFATVGLIVIIVSSRFLVESSINLANQFGIGTGVIGLTIIAIGTSLPELFVAIMAGRRAKGEMVIGTVLGSNLYNLLIVLGVSALITPLVVSVSAIYYTIPMLLLITVYFLWFIRRDFVLRRFEGALLLIIYVLFMVGILTWTI